MSIYPPWVSSRTEIHRPHPLFLQRRDPAGASRWGNISPSRIEARYRLFHHIEGSEPLLSHLLRSLRFQPEQTLLSLPRSISGRHGFLRNPPPHIKRGSWKKNRLSLQN